MGYNTLIGDKRAKELAKQFISAAKEKSISLPALQKFVDEGLKADNIFQPIKELNEELKFPKPYDDVNRLRDYFLDCIPGKFQREVAEKNPGNFNADGTLKFAMGGKPLGSTGLFAKGGKSEPREGNPGDPMYVIHLIENGKEVTLVCYSKTERNDMLSEMKARGLKVTSQETATFEEYKISKRFSEILHDWIGKDMLKVIETNKTPEYKDGNLCATHDYCDANMAMDEAFTSVMGRSFVFYNEEKPETEKQNEADTKIMNNAWSLAKKSDFYNGKFFSEGGKPLGSTGLFETGGGVEDQDCIITVANDVNDESKGFKFLSFDFNPSEGRQQPKLVTSKELAYKFTSASDAYEAEYELRDFFEDKYQYVCRYSDLKKVLENGMDYADGGKPLGSTGLFAKGGKIIYDLPGSNVFIKGFDKDVNGNSVVKLCFADEKTFSIQTNGNLPKTHNIGKNVVSTKKFLLSPYELGDISQEVCDYIKHYGSVTQKSKLKEFDVFAKGGKIKIPKEDKVTMMIAIGILGQYSRTFKETQNGYVNTQREIKVWSENPYDNNSMALAIMNLSNYRKDRVKEGKETSAIDHVLPKLEKMYKQHGSFSEGGKPLGSTGLFAKGGKFDFYERVVYVMKKKYGLEPNDFDWDKEKAKKVEASGQSVDDYVLEYADKHDLSDINSFAEGGKPLGSTGLFAAGASLGGDSPKIYVADLAAYNNGHLRGEWLDLSDYDDGKAVMEEIAKMMKKFTKEDRKKNKSADVVEEWAIHDTENIPSSISSEYMGIADFDKIISTTKVAGEMGIPIEALLDWMADQGKDTDPEQAKDAYQGEYDSESDYAYAMVEEGIVSADTVNIYITDTDRRIIAGEESDNRYEDNDDEDELITDAEMEDELSELEKKRDRKEEVEDELETAVSELTDLEEEVSELESERDSIKPSKDKKGKKIPVDQDAIDEVNKKIDAKQEEVFDKKSTIETLTAEQGDLDDFDFDSEKTSLSDKAKEKLKSDAYDEIYDELKDPVQYFVEDHGLYTKEELVKQSFISIDYDDLAKTLGYDVNYYNANGKVYVFNQNYAKGGTVKKKEHDYTTIAEGNYVAINGEELSKMDGKDKKVKVYYKQLMDHADDVAQVKHVGMSLVKVDFPDGKSIVVPKKLIVRLSYKEGRKIVKK